jgi:hypothetical protein
MRMCDDEPAGRSPVTALGDDVVSSPPVRDSDYDGPIYLNDRFDTSKYGEVEIVDINIHIKGVKEDGSLDRDAFVVFSHSKGKDRMRVGGFRKIVTESINI